MIARYNRLNNHYKEKFGEKTLKICIDGGFTCPNRDGSCGIGGCIFCSERGSGELIKHSKENISKQVEKYLNSYKAQRANKFIVYFQNFTNTYDTIENLKKKYDSALIDKRIVGISIATRPDCIDEKIAQLIKLYSKKYYICVELGLQTSNDNIGKIINRGYTTEQFLKAVQTLNKYEIDTIVHIMCGLPGEKRDSYFKEENKQKIFETKNLRNGKYIPKSIIETVDLINRIKIQGVKIHSTYIVKNTKLEKMYNSNEYRPLEIEEYLSYLTYIITHISKKIIIHRICADSPKDMLIAPEWNLHKKIVMNRFEKLLKEKDLWQGMFTRE